MQKIADSHIHIRFCNVDSINGMLTDLASVGVTDACIMPLPYRGAAENLAALYTKMHSTAVDVRAFGGLHLFDRYVNIPPHVQAQALLDMGCDGFKIMNHPEFRKHFGFGINDPRYDEMFSLFEQRGTPLNIHVNDPEEFWHHGGSLCGEGFPTKQQMYDEIFEVLDRHPRLNVTFAHFFFLSNCPFEAERVMQTYPNVWFDLTPGTEMYYNFDNNLDYWRDFFIRYADRLLFGTDANTIKRCNKELVQLVYRKLTESRDLFTQFCYGHDFTVRGLDLPADVVDKICYRNYFARLGEKKPVNEDMFTAACERVLADIEQHPDDPDYVAGYEQVPDLAADPHQQKAADFCRRALGK